MNKLRQSDGSYKLPTEVSNATANMQKILSKLIVNNAAQRKSKIAVAASKLQKAIDAANITRSVHTEFNPKDVSENMESGTELHDAYDNFNKEVKSTVDYLKQNGFGELETRLYSDQEVKDKVEPLNKPPKKWWV